ncbi:hypothetical protein CICLE_v10026658mg [Citrus x clementina]|uniref:Late embryogenesis abundant protein n=2 Tax=Citrus TaxID=2706 RepID=A0A067GLL6_CITSI|nr:late embryogenesis abundant protein D-29 [Citrus x clementina]XP_006466805.1 late embryogenesis abundant protein D-29 [Citrus sinensis]ESR38903.1 hypothetical protein CICLE_v10026658mg [Citrus x clementina]KDO79575.1 hypothetical protein CISIN_1g031184mg [Citrus sinensis]GAY42691.1 hypothetical protein CUMW_068850 [Citrus unshiu]
MGKGQVVLLMLITSMLLTVAVGFWEAVHDTEGGESGFKVDKRIEVGHDLVDGAADAASKAKDTVKSAASGASQYAADKAGEAANMARDQMDNVKDFATGNARKTLENFDATAKAAKAYDEAKSKVGEAKDKASQTATVEIKGNYEAAKEKASKATADLGKKMTT